ncbi:unnamed protein product [Tuber aestivum]|uniref:Uncharacterized protein n=1 Tax=Tuber aestivum TaxID=59557 RepID=A0A292PLX3_9PEZI|nr:unnamed protein product [Tuber aestivum]
MLLSLRSRSLLLPPFSAHVGPVRKLASSTRRLATTTPKPTRIEMEIEIHEYKEDFHDFVAGIAETLEANREDSRFDCLRQDFWQKQRAKLRKEKSEIRVEIEGLRFELWAEIKEKMKFMGEFNILGALKYIVYTARLNKMIASSVGVQSGLIELAGKEEFIRIVQQEVRDRGLNLEDVIACVPGIYDEVCNRPHDNYCMVVLWALEYTPNQVAALVGFLKMQSEWPYSLDWREDEDGNPRDPCWCCPPKPEYIK